MCSLYRTSVFARRSFASSGQAFAEAIYWLQHFAHRKGIATPPKGHRQLAMTLLTNTVSGPVLARYPASRGEERAAFARSVGRPSSRGPPAARIAAKR